MRDPASRTRSPLSDPPPASPPGGTGPTAPPGLLAVIRRPSWAWGLVAVVGLAALFCFLGRWQYGRHEGKVARNVKLDSDYAAQPVPLAALLPVVAAPLAPTLVWRPVRVTGRYERGATVLVRNRPLDGVYGYEVVVPLRLDDGSALLVDRGWIPNGRTAAEPDSVPAPPPGPVTVTARLRPGEPSLPQAAPPGQELRIDLARIGARVGGPVYRAYAVLAEESPASASAPAALPRPDEDLGPHLAYAWQWWGFAVGAFVVYGYYLRKEATAAGSARPRYGRDPTRFPGRRRRSRSAEPTDEEWEDATDR
jgi:cytochrome oxidase assembly protein ShyY1